MAVIASPNGVVIDLAELSDPGRDPEKQLNEDFCGAAPTSYGQLVVVCDGMGGHAGGQTASRTAVSSILEAVRTAPLGSAPRDVLHGAVSAAARAVYALGGNAPSDVRPGSTCVAVLLSGREAHVAHVGDSRVYLVRAQRAQRMTRDHSLVEEMVDAGVLSREEAAHHPDANKITRALGIQPQVEVELGALLLRPSDVLILTTDGLTDVVADAEIGMLATTIEAPEALCKELVALANQRGGFDNITVQALRVLELPARDEAPSPTLTDMPAGGAASPTKTLIDAAATEADARQQPREPVRPRPVKTTVPDRTLPARPARTVVEEPAGARRTEPGPALVNPYAEAHANAQARAARKASWLLAFSAIIAGLVVGGVAIWWLIGSLRGNGKSDTPPPPEPSPPVREVVPSVTPPEELPDASAPDKPHSRKHSGSVPSNTRAH